MFKKMILFSLVLAALDYSLVQFFAYGEVSFYYPNRIIDLVDWLAKSFIFFAVLWAIFNLPKNDLSSKLILAVIFILFGAIFSPMMIDYLNAMFFFKGIIANTPTVATKVHFFTAIVLVGGGFLFDFFFKRNKESEKKETCPDLGQDEEQSEDK